jgi:hypothetical protein
MIVIRSGPPGLPNNLLRPRNEVIYMALLPEPRDPFPQGHDHRPRQGLPRQGCEFCR